MRRNRRELSQDRLHRRRLAPTGHLLVVFVRCARPVTPGLPPTENSRSTRKTDRDGPRHRWESPACASGYKCMCVADERERANEKTMEREVSTTNQEDRNPDSETRVSQEETCTIMASE
ncbi:hypothetical protein G5I_07018 [Acromyrmex echinatior]|uniref:Uncharacterized protein n=1 Tax=Acromyrmex echinatior TaxID=103372 RepID=F4WMN5_ACREC|nr:hypothetical protein G5I_07018 [Acromyrmex echinatior]